MIRLLVLGALSFVLFGCGDPDGIVVNSGETNANQESEIADRLARVYEGGVITFTMFFWSACECGDGEGVFCEEDARAKLDASVDCIREEVADAPEPPESLDAYLSCYEAHHPEIFSCAETLEAAGQTCDPDDDLSCVDDVDGLGSDCDELRTAEIDAWFESTNLLECDL